MSEGKPDLASVLDHYNVVFKPDRSSQKVLCPVHEEHVQSCSIDLDEGWFNCHACNAKGDSWNLIMLKENCDFVTAIAKSKEFALASGTNVSGSNDAGTYGISGRSRPVSRSRKAGGFRPSLRAAERP